MLLNNLLLKQLLFLAISLLIFYYLYNIRPTLTEGYESYESCLKQGYSRDFCFQVPIQACLTNCG
jgi:hypothetical protein